MEEGIFRKKIKVVAILRGFAEAEVVAAARVFAQSGIQAVEITFNSENAPALVRTIATAFGDRMVIGAGTVLSCEEVRAAKDAGASFILSPHCDPEIIEETKNQNLFSVPGAFTATEIMLAMKAGADLVKIFPAGRLGADYIRDLRGPLETVPMMAVGAVNLRNCRDFFLAGVESVGLGSCLADRQLIKEERFEELAKLAQSFVVASQGVDG